MGPSVSVFEIEHFQLVTYYPKIHDPMSLKKKREMFFCECKPLMAGIQTQYELLKSSWDRKKVVTRLFLHPYPYGHQTLLSYFYGPQRIRFSLDFLLKNQLVV